MADDSLDQYQALPEPLTGDDLAKQITALHWGLIHPDATVGDIAAAGRASAALVTQARDAESEPSDAQVDASRAEVAARMNYKVKPTRVAMRAALRAAVAVGEGGEGR